MKSVFRCTDCKHIIGHVENGKLETDSLVLNVSGTVRCSACGAERFFKSSGPIAHAALSPRQRLQKEFTK